MAAKKKAKKEKKVEEPKKEHFDKFRQILEKIKNSD